MEDKMLIKKKLDQLEKYLNVLKKYRGIDRKSLEEDLETLLIVERSVQLSLQIILDTGNHILADRGVSVSNSPTYRCRKTCLKASQP